jgi:hypothetical protein
VAAWHSHPPRSCHGKSGGKPKCGYAFSINFTNTKLSVTGSYTEKSDCLGTAQVTPKGSAAMNFNTVEVNGGKELLLIETDSGTFLSGTAQE